MSCIICSKKADLLEKSLPIIPKYIQDFWNSLEEKGFRIPLDQEGVSYWNPRNESDYDSEWILNYCSKCFNNINMMRFFK